MSEEAVNKIHDFLKKMNLKYKFVEKDKVFIVPFSGDTKPFNVLVLVREEWVSVIALAARKDELPPNLDKERFYETLLRLTLELNEVTFGLTEEGDVVVHAETHVKALEFENFKIEFTSVVFGVDYFAKRIAGHLPLIEHPPSEVSKKISSYVW